MAIESSSIENALIESEGQITPLIEEMLSCKDIELPEKIDSYAYRQSRLSVMELWYKEKAEEFSKIAKSYAKAQAQLKENAKVAMELLGTDELKGHDYRIKISKSKGSVLIKDEAAIDPKYIVSEVVTRIDKSLISKDIADGKEVFGAELQGSTSLRVYPNAGK